MPRMPSPGGSRRYRRVAVTYTVAREQAPTSWPTLSSPEAAAEFARELLAAHDDDREHFWAIFLNAQNGYTGHHLVSTGSLSAVDRPPSRGAGARAPRGRGAPDPRPQPSLGRPDAVEGRRVRSRGSSSRAPGSSGSGSTTT